jgi:sugar O-acyltransferase (sialic acid O-acetyltransferase NeuD family)
MSMASALWIIGAGGHAKVVIESARASGLEVAGLIDERTNMHGTSLLGCLVLGGVRSIPVGAPCVIAVGDSRARERVAAELDGRVTWTRVIHPRAEIARDVDIGQGTVVFAMAVVQPGSVIGRHAIINTATVVEHDDSVGDFAQLATAAKLTGRVAVGTGAFIGAGAVVLPGVRVGAWSVVGAGAVVTHDVQAGQTVAGVPARELRDASPGRDG